MSDYSKITNFLSKDSLALNDPAKYVKGSEIDAEYNAIAAAIATKADTASPTMSSPTITGTITATIANFSGLVTAALGLTVSGAAFNSRGITDNATAKALTLSGSGANSVTIANSATNPTISTNAGNLVLTAAGGTVDVTGDFGITSATAATTLSALNNGAGYAALSATSSGTTNAYLFLNNATSGERVRLIGDNSGNCSISTGGNFRQVMVTHTASADRYITLTGSNGGNPTIGTSAGALLVAPATGFMQLNGVTTAGLLLNAATGNVALCSFYVNGTEVGRVSAGAANAVNIGTSSTGTQQVSITHTASADRYITLTGSNGGNPTIGTSAGALNLSAGGVQGLVINPNATANTYAQFILPASGGNYAALVGLGSGADVGMFISSKGTGAVSFYTNSLTNVQAAVLHTASADRYITLTGSNGGNPTIGTSAGGLALAPGGTGEASHVFIQSNTGAATPVRVTTLGLAIGANYSAGPGEVDFYNSYYTATASFDFRQITASGVSASVARLIPISGGVAGLAIVQGSGTVNARIGTEAASNIVIGTGSALATTATTNHMMIPTCAGTPTGVPVGAGAGQLAMIYDTTNNFLYVYNGGWKKSTAYA